MKNMKTANNLNRFKALKLAEIKETDSEDFDNCVNDMTKTASLNNDEALIVASAIRSKYLPNILKEAGLNEMINLEDEAEETADFANDMNEDDDMEMHHFENDEDDEDMEMSDDDMDDEDEVEDTDTATFEIEVPADMVDAAKQAVQEALDNLLGEDEDLDVDMEDGDEDFEDEMETEEEVDEMDSEEDMETEEDDSEASMHKSSNKVNSMTRQALAARRAEREEILRRLASEEEHYPQASAGFKTNNEMANMPGETEYPTMKLQGENSLKDQNPSWADQPVPTMNNLDDHPGISSSKLQGTPSGDLEYVCDWEALENPSEGYEVNMFAVPTDMPMEHNTQSSSSARVASDHSEKISVECTSCGYRMSMREDEMAEAECPKCAGMDKDGEDEEDVEEAMTTINVPRNELQLKVSNTQLETARIKTAYSCSSKLAIAGIIETAEVDSYAEQMLNDNLKADAMIRQTKLLLKSAQASSERVAAAAAERMNNVKTASTMGISTSPAFNSSSAANSAALDIQSALKGTWTMPTIED
jgi:hypothetical protein